MLYASNFLTALSIGFSVAGGATSRIRSLQSANLAAAVVCGLGAVMLRFVQPRAAEPLARNPPLDTQPSLPTVDFSIVIPVYNRPEFVRTLLAHMGRAAAAWESLGRGEIVVVDDGSVDDTAAVGAELAAGMPLPTRVVSIPHRGPGAARNAGFAVARGRIGVAIDSDCLPDDGWLRGLLNEVHRDSNTIAFSRIRAARKFVYPIENAPDAKGFVSASFAMNREAFCAIGGFYSGYGMSHEDIDFVHMARTAGFRIVRADSYIDHPMRRETAQSIWRVGLNSKYANLFAHRHGSSAYGLTKTTPYYFFGIAGNYGSSIALVVGLANIIAGCILRLVNPHFANRELRQLVVLLAAAAALYALALAALGLAAGAGVRRLPNYVATLGSFQVATLLGRLKGSLEYGVLLL